MKDFDSGMWFLSFVATLAMILPVAFMFPGQALSGRRSFERVLTPRREQINR